MNVAVVTIWLAVGPSVAVADCPDLEGALLEAEEQVVTAQLSEAQQALARAEESFACGAIVSAGQIGRFWRAEGALLNARGRSEEAALSFAAARRVAPESWTPRFDATVMSAYEAAIPLKGEPSLLRVDPWTSAYRAFIDGRATSLPAAVSPGLHLVQVRAADGQQAVFARIVLTADGAPLTVRSALPVEAAEAALPAPAEAPRRAHPVGLLAGGGASALVGGALLGIGAALNGVYAAAPDAYDAGELSLAQARQRVVSAHSAQIGLGVSGAALIAGGAGLLVTGVLTW